MCPQIDLVSTNFRNKCFGYSQDTLKKSLDDNQQANSTCEQIQIHSFHQNTFDLQA